MNFSTQGIIIWTRPIQEKSCLIKCLTEDAGIISGFVNSINSKKVKSAIFLGTLININYYGKENSTGKIVPEAIRNYLNSCIDNRLLFFIILCTCDIANFLLGKDQITSKDLNKDTQTGRTFIALKSFFEQCSACQNKELDSFISAQFIIMIKILLTEAGYGFNLESCVATGSTDIKELKFLSPKSSGAVSVKAAKNYPNVFLNLPSFFITHNTEEVIENEEIIDGIKIIDFFLLKISKIYINESIPDSWERTISLLRNRFGK